MPTRQSSNRSDRRSDRQTKPTDPSAQRSSENPLKSQGQTKRRTTALADRSSPAGIRRAAGRTATGQGGSTAQRRSAASNTHPSQHGGATADDPSSDPRHDAAPKRPGVKRPDAKPAGRGTATAPSRTGGQKRTGRTDNDRKTPSDAKAKRARSGSR